MDRIAVDEFQREGVLVQNDKAASTGKNAQCLLRLNDGVVEIPGVVSGCSCMLDSARLVLSDNLTAADV
jgi:hypothetical protein